MNHGTVEALPLPERAVSTKPRWQAHALAALVLGLAMIRVWVIQHRAEPDADAAGHLGIAAAVLKDPWNVRLHWVYPPGYHFLLAGFYALGGRAEGVRYLNCALAALLPLVVWHYAERTLHPSQTTTMRYAPFIAAMLCAAMPVVNLLGTSAEPGTFFALLVLSSVWAIDGGRFWLGGCLLAMATMVRFEAWGALGVLVGLRGLGLFPKLVARLPAPLQRACALPLEVVIPPLLATGAWFLAHRVADGSWFGFLRELYRYTHVQREQFHQGTLHDLIWFPVVEPWFLFGVTIPLLFIGLYRAFRVGFVVPLGIYGFLLGSYLFKGALASARYYESLAPFVCISAAYGVCLLGQRWRYALPVAFALSFAHVLRLLMLVGVWTFHMA
jgi:hypothetical protein